MDIKPKQFVEKQIEKLLKIFNIKKLEKEKAAVFFDIDGTISRNDNLEMLISEITKRDLLPADKEMVVEETRKLWKRRELDFGDYLKHIIELIPNLKDFSYSIMHKIAEDVVREEGSHYYLFPWMFLIRLKAMGYKLIAVSGAPEFMAKMYLDKIGLLPWKIHGSSYEFKNNVFTGKVDLSVLNNKGDFIEKEYKNIFDLNKCIALGDTVSDISMLQKVGKKIVINPTFELAEMAQTKKWPVVLERKDLVLIFPEGKLKI